MKVDAINYKLVTKETCKPEDRSLVENFNRLNRGNPPSRISPFQYQIDVARKIHEIVTDPGHENGVIILRNPTGSGKSLAGYSGTLLHGFRSVFMYPTKELVREQYGKFMEYRIEGELADAIPFVTDTAMKINEDETQRFLERKQSDIGPDAREKYKKADAIVDIYSESKAIFTTIDSFYYSMSYALSRDGRYASYYQRTRSVTADTVKAAIAVRFPDIYFFDEFDSYDVKQKCEIEWMIIMLCHLAFQRRGNACVILASATPDDDMITRLRSIGIKIYDDFREQPVQRADDTRQILPDVLVEPIGIRDFRGMVHLTSFFTEDNIKKIKEHVAKGLRVVFIGDSVKDCMDVARLLKDQCGFKDDIIGEIHGLGSVTDDDRFKARQKSVVVGNRTIDLGIDFDADVLVMAAPTPQLFEQRFGRLRGARTRDCTCYMLLPSSVAIGLSENFGASPVARESLHEFLYRGNQGTPIYRWYSKHEEFRRNYAPIEFLNVLDDLSGGLLVDGYAPNMISQAWKGQIADAARQIFPTLYKRDIDDIARQRAAIRSQAASGDERRFLDWIFMQFRPSSLLDVIVYDITNHACKIYNVETILRYGIVDPARSCIIEKTRIRNSDPWHNIVKENWRHFDNRIPVIAITGYTPPGEKGRNVYYTAPSLPFYKDVIKPNGNLTTEYQVSKPTPDAEAEDTVVLHGLQYPAIIKGWSGIRLVSDDASVQAVINQCVNPLLKEEIHAIFFAIQPRTDRYSASTFAFAIEAKLRLPMLDKTAPFIIDVPAKTKYGTTIKPFIGIIGIDLHAFLLEGVLKERDFFLRSR